MKIQKLSNSSFHEDADLAKKINEIIDVIQEDEKNGMYQKAEEKPQCPFCDAKDSLTMKKETVSKPKASGLLTATFDVWKCSACKESFFQHWNYNFIDTNNA